MSTPRIDPATIPALVHRLLAQMLGLDVDEITPTSRIVDDLGADSLDVLEIAMAFEEECHIAIPDEDAERFDTVATTIEYLQRRTAA